MINNIEASKSSERPRYVACNGWSHIFLEAERGEVERTTRWVYDREEETLLFLDIHRDQKWRVSTLAELDDLSDSLINGNPGCLDNPDQWSFVESDTPPNWI